MAESDQRVLVTGASGFIALHCVRELLERGYNVRGTLRSLAREDEVRKALANTAGAQDRARLEFVETDLTKDDGWDAAVAGCDYVLHLASPLPMAEPDDENELIVPAREGVLRVLKAASGAGVKRVVMTSSVASIVYGHNESRVFTEADWSNVDAPIGAYAKSKTLAERAAWDFMASLPQGTMELAAINPGLVLGPALNADTSPSLEVVRKLLAREVPGSARFGWAPVDVRDIAWLHVEAMINPDAAGKRFICALDHTWMEELAEILSTHGFRVPTRKLPSFVVRLVALFDKTVRMVLHELGKREDVSNEQTRRVLGWQPRSVEEATLSAARSLSDLGVV